VVDEGSGRATDLGARCGDQASRSVRVTAAWAWQN